MSRRLGVQTMAEIVTTQTPNQLQVVFGEISRAAETICRLALMLTDRGEIDSRDVEAQRYAIESLAERIGLLADWSNESVSFQARSGKVEDWLLPPAWHPEQEEASYG